MNDYAEKRAFYRMTMECQIDLIDPMTGQAGTATLQDMSASGVSMTTQEAMQVGETVRINVVPENDITPPLEALVSVIRCEPAPSGGFAIAASIVEIGPAQLPKAQNG